MNASNCKSTRVGRTTRQQNQRIRTRAQIIFAQVYNDSKSRRKLHSLEYELTLRLYESPHTHADILPSYRRDSAVTCVGGGGLPRKVVIITTSKDGTKSKRIIKIKKTKKSRRPCNFIRNR